MSDPGSVQVAMDAQPATTGERDRLFVLLYDELHRMAQRELRRGGGGLMLTTTSLLHETYLNISQRHAIDFPDRARFMGYASRAMRGLIIDYMRSRQAQKRGGEFEITSLPTEPPMPAAAEAAEAAAHLLRVENLNEALEFLTQIDARLAECVDLKFFCGLSFVEIARLRQVSERTVARDWDKARTLLRHFLMNKGNAFPDAEPFGL